jgi:hypothetical protein
MERSWFVVGLFREPEQARDAIEALRRSGFAGGDVSVVLRGVDGADEQDRDAAAAGAAVGGVLGGLAGWLVGAGTLAIPGAGPLVAAGAFASAAVGAFTGAGLGTIAGRLASVSGMGAETASWYEEEVRSGSALVTVRADARAGEARDMLQARGAYRAEAFGASPATEPAARPAEPLVGGGAAER